MLPLLLVRPEPGLSASKARAEALGLDVIACPLFDVVPLPWDAPDPAGFDALLLTSANAVRHGGPGLSAYRHLPVFAVGRATADAARSAGFKVVRTGETGVEDLLAAIPDNVRLFHPGGRHRHEHGADRSIIVATVYESRAIKQPPLPVGAPLVAAIHSLRAGRRLAELVADRSSVTIAAISDAALAACGDGWRMVAIAEHPADEQLLALAAKLCQTGEA